ncbi:MAG: helix-turn-helix domain-containing protein [Anaerolineae bacterium]|nr:helix-turn-helix domain-containing protein [Anaerolineae bacterium]
MSVKVMTHVWQASQSEKITRLVLLALADNANDGGDAMPGIGHLAAKTRLSERTVQLHLNELERMGEVQVFPHCGLKTDNGWTNLYRIVMPGKPQPVYNHHGKIVQARPPKKRSTKKSNLLVKADAIPIIIAVMWNGDEGVNADSPPAKGQGVNADSPQGVNADSPKPSVEPSVKKTLTSAPSTQSDFGSHSDVTPDGVAGVDSKPEKPRDLVFDAVSLYIFKTDPELTGGPVDEKGKPVGGRIGAISAWLSAKTDGVRRGGKRGPKVVVGQLRFAATPQQIKQFADDWESEHDGVNLPLDFERFVEHWRAWATAQNQRAGRSHRQHPQPKPKLGERYL